MNNHLHKYDLGIIGNCSYLAYINKNSDIRWMCWPSFDSDPVFFDLIDEEKGGNFSITPAKNFHSKQHYIHNTNILVTEFHAQDGIFQVIVE